MEKILVSVVNDIVIEAGTAIQKKGITVFDLGKIWEEKIA